MSDQKSATPDIDTQIESLVTQAVYEAQLEYDIDSRRRPNFEIIDDTTKAIKALLIQSKIEELEAIMDFDDEPVHLNFDEEINPITVGERIDQLKEEL